jgi:hypothetical protein
MLTPIPQLIIHRSPSHARSYLSSIYVVRSSPTLHFFGKTIPLHWLHHIFVAVNDVFLSPETEDAFIPASDSEQGTCVRNASQMDLYDGKKPERFHKT